MDVLGGRFYSVKFCARHAGLEKSCTHLSDCAMRVLWTTVQEVLDGVLKRVTLKDLLCNEQEMARIIEAGGQLLPLWKLHEQPVDPRSVS